MLGRRPQALCLPRCPLPSPSITHFFSQGLAASVHQAWITSCLALFTEQQVEK